MIVIGDSFTQCAINDSIFSGAVNVSCAGAAYIYSYVSLRKFLSVNPHVDTVLLSFHDEAIAKERDFWVTGAGYTTSLVPIFLPWFHKEEMLYMTKSSAFCSAVTKSIATSVKCVLQIASNGYVTYKDMGIGQYERVYRVIPERKDEIEPVLKNKETEHDGYSLYQHDYLLKIIELCKAHSVKLILFNSPVYRSDVFDNKPALNEYYNRYLSGIKYLDFSSFDLPRDGYADRRHLNYKGAEIFSRYLQNNYEAVFGD